jgi:ferredoxin
MIVADRKPFEEIVEKVKDCKKVLVLGCGTCVAVCMAGGEREVGLLASELRMASMLKDAGVKFDELTIQRQCDREFIEPIMAGAKQYDCILSLACGAGVQLLAEMVAPQVVKPGLNTRFIGYTVEEGRWAENCLACGDCVLGEYGGICPKTTCSKGLLNGACGGGNEGLCEAADGRPCAWELIYTRLKGQNRLELLAREPLVKDMRKKDHPMKQINPLYAEHKPEEPAVAAE